MRDACPKCGTKKSGDACPKCGLVFAKFNKSVLDQDVPEPIEKLWRSVESVWEDKARHAIFVERALLAGSLGFAARCYRLRENDPMAKAQLKTIEKRLQQVMLSSQTERSGCTPRRRLSLGLLLLFFGIIFTILFYGMHYFSK